MATRRILRQKLRTSSIGDMNKPITLYKISLRTASSTTSHAIKHSVVKEIAHIWSKIESVNPYSQFNWVNQEGDKPSHKFTIRYGQTVGDGGWVSMFGFPLTVGDGYARTGAEPDSGDVRIKDNNLLAYRILKVENYENKDLFLVLYAKLLGPYSIEINQ